MSASSNSNEITANWSSSSDSGVGMSHYEFSISTDGKSSWDYLGTVSGTSKTFNSSDGVTYWCRVRAVDQNGNKSSWSVSSSSLTFSSPVDPPSVTTGSAYTEDGGSTVTIHATAFLDNTGNSNEVDVYVEYRHENSSNWNQTYAASNVSTTGDYTAQIIVSKPEYMTLYYYRAKAVNSAGSDYGTSQSIAIQGSGGTL